MSRSGYVDDYDDENTAGLWRGAVMRSINGKRGQAFLREMRDAIDAMPVKELARSVLVSGDRVCAMGAVAKARGTDVSNVDPESREDVATVMGIAPSLAAEIAFENDQDFCADNETPAERWQRMRDWVNAQIRPEVLP